MDKMPELRRKFARVEASLYMRYKTATMADFKNATTCDISGGGVQFISEHKIPINTQVLVLINIPGAPDPVEAEAEVRGYEQKKEEKEGKQKIAFLIGIKFTKINLEARKSIIRYTHSMIKNISNL